MEEIDSRLYQACLVFPVGTQVPLTFHFGFIRDDGMGEVHAGYRSITVDNNLPQETDLMYGFDGRNPDCGIVATEGRSWGSLKGKRLSNRIYRS